MMEIDDSRPFTVFREHLQHFKSRLDADVAHCLDTLDPKVLELVGNWHTSSSRPLDAQMEISKAKQDINCFMKDMINEIGEQWMQHLIQIRDNLVENVESFLAGIQLEPLPAPMNPVPKPARPSPPKTNDPATAPPPPNWVYPPQGVSTASQMPNQQQPQHSPQQQPYTTYPAYHYPHPVVPNAYNPYGQIGLPHFQPDDNNNTKKRKRAPDQLVEKMHPFGEGTSKMQEGGDFMREFQEKWEEEIEKIDCKDDYKNLVALNDVRLVANVEAFECPVCFLDVEAGDGAILQDCLHGFCKECLASSVQYSDTAMVKCPFRNDEYSCESHLREREIKCLVTPEMYEKHLQRSMALAESQAQNSFHCKTPDCRGWCLFEDDVNTFRCPVCEHTNCLTCAAIHEGKNCRQYQDAVDFNSNTSKEAKKTRQYLQSMLKKGDAMQCPQCQVILMKKEGCDWFMCSMCKTEVCWVTKGPRWGPKGKGDTSGGCKCMVKGKKCHPKCGNCH